MTTWIEAGTDDDSAEVLLKEQRNARSSIVNPTGGCTGRRLQRQA